MRKKLSGLTYPGAKGTWTRLGRKVLSCRPTFTLDNLRVFGSLGFMAGQIVFLFYSQPLGLAIFIGCQFFSIPYFVRKKCWDIVLLSVIGMAINFAGLAHIHNSTITK